MSLPGQTASARRRYRTAAVAAALALAGGTFAAGTTAANASIAVPASGSLPAAGSAPATSQTSAASSAPATGAQSATVWAATASGREVQLAKPVFVATPVHPEKITHPAQDFMGSTVASHFAGGQKVARAQAITPTTVPQIPGVDVSGYQGDINWGKVAPYIDFTYAKATEGDYYTNPDFYNQYEGPYDYHLTRGAYHFAIPSNSSGEAQANFFISHGGGWSGDGRTLPGALDIEYNPYGSSECYGLTQSQMVNWVRDFVKQYAYREHVYPTIYTTTDWWQTCTGNNGSFGRTDPLWIANYSASGGGPLPRGWGFYTFWQYRDSGSLPGDQDVFNGADSRLKVLAKAG